MAEAVAAGPPTADYGIDAPLTVRHMFTRGGWFAGIGIVMYLINHAQYPFVSARILAVMGFIGVVFWAVGAFMLWSSKVAKLGLRDRLLDSLQLKGDEKLLDAGCGRGLMLIGAAKRLKSGRATGIDVWNPAEVSGNSADACKQNAKIEGVSDRVRIETGDIRKLVYPAGNYDVVISVLAIHNLADEPDRDQAVSELWRVLKPGGRLLIYDILHTGAYAKKLRNLGAADVALSGFTWLWGMPSRSLLARKS